MKTVAFDFDGVIHSYTSGWMGTTKIPDPPVIGIQGIIAGVRATGISVAVVSSRAQTFEGRAAIAEYLHKHGIEVDMITCEKVPAIAYVDDRAITFNGSTDGLLERILFFKSWTEMK